MSNIYEKYPFSFLVLSVCLLFAEGAPAQGVLISDFDDGLQGWSEGSPLACGINAFGGNLEWYPAGGNPQGYIRSVDAAGHAGGTNSVLAPAILTGDLSQVGGLTWDALLPNGASWTPDILIEGQNGTCYRSDPGLLPSQPFLTWFTKRVSFESEDGWTRIGPGVESFSSVVTNVKALYIELEVVSGLSVEASIDNVRTVGSTSQAAVSVPLPALVFWVSFILIGTIGISARNRI